MTALHCSYRETLDVVSKMSNGDDVVHAAVAIAVATLKDVVDAAVGLADAQAHARVGDDGQL